MACFHPIEGFRSAEGGLTMSRAKSPTKTPVCVPCGQCLGCRVDKREQWKLRMMHEASLHDENCFVTFTYSPEHLVRPWLNAAGEWRGSVSAADVSGAIKRLRRRIEPQRLRFHFKTEYSPGVLQPHGHGAFFGWRPSDLVPCDRSAAGFTVYSSAFLDEVWGKGLVGVGDLTAESCGYIANHNVDKLDGQKAKDAYSRFDYSTGEIFEVEPETCRMSTHPGIGRGWIDQFERDCFPSNFIIVDGRKKPVPRYYKQRLKDRFSLPQADVDRLVPVDDAKVMSRKSRARARTPEFIANSTPERLAVREECLLLATSRLKRDSF